MCYNFFFNLGKTMNNLINVEDILDNLSYRISTPEVESFHFHLKTGNVSSAERILIENGVEPDEIQAVLLYFKNKYHSKKKFVEHFPVEYANLKDNDLVLVSYGGNVFSTSLILDRHDHLVFVDMYSHLFVNIEKANQIWKIEIF